MSLADAQILAARKLRTKAASDTAARPGPPLPRSHPAPALLAKLYLEAAALYSTARALAKTPAPAAPIPAVLAGSKKGMSGGGGAEAAKELRRYLADEGSLHSALAHAWLGVDAGEAPARGGAVQRTGEAVGFLTWARNELDDLMDGGAQRTGSTLGVNIGDAADRDREMRERRRAIVRTERAIVDTFLSAYKRENDTVSSIWA
jgi:hypothetical protein